MPGGEDDAFPRHLPHSVDLVENGALLFDVQRSDIVTDLEVTEAKDRRLIVVITRYRGRWGERNFYTALVGGRLR